MYLYQIMKVFQNRLHHPKSANLGFFMELKMFLRIKYRGISWFWTAIKLTKIDINRAMACFTCLTL